MKPMNRKCAQFTDSVIRRMTRIAIANNAINLAQGFPDFDPPKAITDRLKEVADSGPHQYPITMGAPNFRRAVAEKSKNFSGLYCLTPMLPPCFLILPTADIQSLPSSFCP